MGVREIIRYTRLTQVPQSPEFVEGVLNLRGQVIPVIDLRRRFALNESEHGNSTRIVVVEMGHQIVGLIVDSVSEVRNIDRDQISPPPAIGAEIDASFIEGMGKVDDRLVILLNLDRVFSADEQNLLSETAA